MTLRELPGILGGRRWLTADVDRPIVTQMTMSGFLLLEEPRPTDTVLGLAARAMVAVSLGAGFGLLAAAVSGLRRSRVPPELPPAAQSAS